MKLINKYTKVPDEFMKLNPSLAITRVMFYLLRWQNAEEHYSSHETIARECDLHVSNVKRALNFLKKEKFITVISGKKDRRTNFYIINFDQIDGECVLTSEQVKLRKLNYNKLKIKEEEKEIEDKFLKIRSDNKNNITTEYN